MALAGWKRLHVGLRMHAGNKGIANRASPCRRMQARMRMYSSRCRQRATPACAGGLHAQAGKQGLQTGLLGLRRVMVLQHAGCEPAGASSQRRAASLQCACSPGRKGFGSMRAVRRWPA